jgi:hypothetical protein
MSICEKCYEDVGCTCKENDRIADFERQLAEAKAENKRLREALECISEGEELGASFHCREYARQALKEVAGE